MLSELTEQIHPLKALELEVAQQLGMSREPEDVDKVTVLLKDKASRNGDDLSLLHRLCLQYSCAQLKLSVELKLCPSPQGPSYHADGSQFYAVLIGINEYASYPLHGCISDVRLMEQYLTEDLGVPRERIQLFLGSREHISPADTMNPSHAHIIGALLSIVGNPKIAYNDNIIIYYSRHGSCYSIHETEYIETLCPIDHDTPGDNGKPGHRITVILDCCHSGGASRDLPEPGARKTPPTTVATLEDMLLTGDKNLRHYPGYQSILLKDWYPDMDSHVVLAACKAYQFAKPKAVEGKDGEVGYIGIFMDSLVRVLRSGYWKKETTYTDLVHCFDKTSHQTPVVAGKYKGAHIWYQD
ncbi:hypothetical protein ARMSODRAFT_1024541 [Armillaria solidipes]|uniref:Peptidase C14 caspase domain-containing protein n=1 Tax=Armillaria solidipes TaxID=1076256 RepID=A0A2H3AVJ1_9AGAR|nr:hypothetical protein ARMSODRAFT_1024541 [Armillaria solidipes]